MGWMVGAEDFALEVQGLRPRGPFSQNKYVLLWLYRHQIG